jgi:hypothetical protein
MTIMGFFYIYLSDVLEIHDANFEVSFFFKFYNPSLALVVEDFNIFDSPDFPNSINVVVDINPNFTIITNIFPLVPTY